jgi:hypothetical protein
LAIRGRKSASTAHLAIDRIFDLEKLVLLCSLQGDSVYYDLGPANTDERDAAEQVFQRCQHLDILADKGFISDSWQAQQTQQGIYVWIASHTLKTFLRRFHALDVQTFAWLP